MAGVMLMTARPVTPTPQEDGEHMAGDWQFVPRYPRYITKY